MNGVAAVFPQLLGNGGVQRLGRHMALALARACERRGLPLHILSLSDPCGEHQALVGEDGFRFKGHDGSRFALLKGFRSAARTAAAAWFGHPFVAVLGLSTRVPYLVHAHGIEAWVPMSRLRRVAIRRARIVSASSDFTAGEVVRLQGVAAQRLTTLHPALDSAMMIAQDVGERESTILCVSRMEEGDRGKNIDLAIRAFARASAGCPEWTFQIVGDGSDRPRLEAIARSSEAPIVFPGRVDEEELRRLYRCSALFCLPSTKEGFGIVFLEAMASGLPVLAVHATAVPEVVLHEETGLLSPVNDIDALASNMERLMSSSEGRFRMGKRSLDQAANFLMADFQKNVDALLGELLGEVS